MSDDKDQPSTADHVGQAAGGITGVLAGAAIGSTAGPIGTLLGGVAGAIGGWWSGRAIAEAAEDITSADDQYFRDHFAATGDARRTYDDAQAAYYLGHVAAANRDYAAFDQVEAELSRGWNASAASRGEWQAVSEFASVGFDRGRERRRKPR
jgi:phage tail tape-measure protein